MKIFLGLAKGFLKLKNLFFGLLKILAMPFKTAGRFLVDYLFLPFYKVYLFLTRKTEKVYHPTKNKVGFVFTSKYFIHVLITTIGILIVFNNINAQETRAENYGESTIVYALSRGNTFSALIEEEASTKTKSTVVSYLNQPGQIKSGVAPNAEKLDEDKNTDLAAITQGGTTVIKPTITKPVSESQIEELNEDVQVYTVEGGDTLGTIAEKFGISVATILWENDLYENQVIKPGDKLKILPTTGLTHKVVKGESLSGIAGEYEADENKILEYNKIIAASDLKIGETIIIPDGKKEIKKYVPPAPAATQSPAYAANNTAPSIKNVFVPENKQVSPGGKMAWPTSWRVITQYYHWAHHGLDIDGDYNSPIYAADSGVIIRQGWGNGYGNMIIVDHGNGVQTLYAHLSKFFLQQGAHVSKGQTMGMMGTTGRSTGTHLHFEVIINGAKMNPLSYIR